MKKLIAITLFISSSVWAHHSRDHMMLAEDAEQVIFATQQGAKGGGLWLLWVGVFLFLLLGIIRWWKGRS
ncbi:hypothetical protein MNBD_GAMMA25-2125 [hydrothermal vent metagenome]|uniref:Uncharacterized protein n=1 Tax=hydrothermal vent metagenome TaxID=652676 RepID=A0A3B1B682_9ZZZZ